MRYLKVVMSDNHLRKSLKQALENFLEARYGRIYYETFFECQDNSEVNIDDVHQVMSLVTVKSQDNFSALIAEKLLDLDGAKQEISAMFFAQVTSDLIEKEVRLPENTELCLDEVFSHVKTLKRNTYICLDFYSEEDYSGIKKKEEFEKHDVVFFLDFANMVVFDY